jgi:rhomboid protease GluP
MEQDPPPPRAPKDPVPVVAIVLIMANVGAFFLSMRAGADAMSPDPELMFEIGGNFGPVTLGGESWRLLTSMFLHYGVIHLAMNMVGLALGGMRIEEAYGRAGFLALYLFAGVIGGLASALGGQAVSVGASGAVFGIFGAWGAYLLLRRKELEPEQLKAQATSLGTLLAINIVIGFQKSGLDHRAHIGGLIAGFLAGLVLQSGKQYLPRVVGVFVAFGLAIGAAHVLPKPQNRVLLPSAKEKIDSFGRLEQKALDRYIELGKKAEEIGDAAAADVIEKEILPTWREGKVLIWSIEHLPDDLETNLREYVEIRERAWVAMVPALRNSDEKAVKAAIDMMAEAETYIEKLKE